MFWKRQRSWKGKGRIWKWMGSNLPSLDHWEFVQHAKKLRSQRRRFFHKLSSLESLALCLLNSIIELPCYVPRWILYFHCKVPAHCTNGGIFFVCLFLSTWEFWQTFGTLAFPVAELCWEWMSLSDESVTGRIVSEGYHWSRCLGRKEPLTSKVDSSVVQELCIDCCCSGIFLSCVCVIKIQFHSVSILQLVHVATNGTCWDQKKTVTGPSKNDSDCCMSAVVWQECQMFLNFAM